MKHTPGPWRYKKGPMGLLISERHSLQSGAAATVYADIAAGVRVAVAPNVYSEDDARLIAAAPDMYEALELHEQAKRTLEKAVDMKQGAERIKLFKEFDALAILADEKRSAALAKARGK